MATRLESAERLLRTAGEHTLDLLFPPICVACGSDIQADATNRRLCCWCLGQLPRVDQRVCQKCAAPLPATDGIALDCPICSNQSFRFDKTIALGWYDGLLRELILRMKTDRSASIAYALADLVADRLKDGLAAATIDLAIPVPMHRRKQWQRGVHATSLLCDALARRANIQCTDRLLKKSRATTPQIGLSRVGRQRNVRGALTIGRRVNLRGQTVLVVDDVMTTGATSNEAARVLKHAGARQVLIAVAARTKGG